MASKGIKDYTTKISASVTIGEVTEMLVAGGATTIMTEYANGVPTGLTFALPIDGHSRGFSLPCRYEGVLASLQRTRASGNRLAKDDEEQAARTAWRLIKDWVDVQLAMIDAGLAEMEEVFMPYMIVGNKRTVFQDYKLNGHRLLEAPKSSPKKQ